MRKLVTLRQIDALSPIPDADAIEVATIGGWKVVVKKGEFAPGDPCIYFEIDSFLPDGNPAWQFLVDKQPREFEGRRGHRLRTIKLRGQISQGFVVPVDALPQIVNPREGEDFSELLGVVKWEPPIPAELAGQVEGPFPGWMRKTDQERCQNLVEEIFVQNKGAKYEVTVKLDGSSMTVFARGIVDPSDPSLVQMESGVCSRNLQLKVNEANANNTLVRLALQSGLLGALEDMARDGHSFAVQGELMGPGIQGNREGLKTHQFFVFDVQDLNRNVYLTPEQRHELVAELHRNGVKPELVQHVPIAAYQAELLDTLGITNVEGLLNLAERGKSLNHPIREGLVFKRIDGGFSFKAISNLFLAKEKD